MNGTIESDLLDETNWTGFPPEDPRHLQKLRVFEQSQLCFKKINAAKPFPKGYCPPIWDELACWPLTKSGVLGRIRCPDYIFNFNTDQYATKKCTDEGDWYVKPDSNTTWTNYSLCFAPNLIDTHPVYADWIPVIKIISIAGYALSLLTLIIAVFILIMIKKLRCPRNTLHINLFLSFIFRATMSLAKHLLLKEGLGLQEPFSKGQSLEDLVTWACKALVVLWQYCIVANYSWILMEGLYLHNLIFLAPFSDSSAITGYVILGWGLPMGVIATWVACRIKLDDTLCWTSSHQYEQLFLIIRIPIIVSIVVNFFFFVNITRVLLLKLQSAVSIESRKYRYRKWAKSTLVLVPLFGIHYMLFIWMSYFMGKHPVIEVVWLFCDQLFGSFQGFFVAILYCLLNGEVRQELSKKWGDFRSMPVTEIWVPLQHITSRLHRSTVDDEGFSNISGDGLSHHYNLKEPLRKENCRSKSKSVDGEVTEEHHIEITQED